MDTYKKHVYRNRLNNFTAEVYHWVSEIENPKESTVSKIEAALNCSITETEYVLNQAKSCDGMGNVQVLNTFLSPERFRRAITERSTAHYNKHKNHGIIR